jgi:pimeloyl-ACP methyl ester carboxylesterase
MATFVLVHGAWHGAWCWRRVARLLAAQNHDVFTPTLTGVGERVHLARADTGLDTHILDVANEIRWQELTDVVLVGHSYGGFVISGVAELMEKSIGSFVMLDAFFPQSGDALVDLAAPVVVETIVEAERRGDTTLAPRSAAVFKVNERDRAWVDAQCTAHPIKSFTQKLTLTGARERVPKKAYIRAAGYPYAPFDSGLAAARGRGWRTYEMPCGHDAMLDMPERLAEILHEVA